jgi:sugar (pentulose or hexulose) kinase
MLGFGIVGEGVTADVTGTSSLLASHSEKPLIHPGVQNLRHVVDGWIPFTIMDCGGLSMKWCRDLVSSLVGEDASYDALIDMARQAPPGSDGLIFYPYMLGERRKENTSARGGFSGLTLNHSGRHFVRAVMEGVALGLGRDVALCRSLGLDIREVLCVGGGTRNVLWNEIKANITQAPFQISEEPEAGLKGAALLGAAGVGLVDDLVATAVERRTISETVEPNPDELAAYEQALAEFTRYYDHMLGYWSVEPA